MLAKAVHLKGNSGYSIWHACGLCVGRALGIYGLWM